MKPQANYISKRRLPWENLNPRSNLEIQRLSKREIRATFVPLRREVRAMRLRLSSLSKNFSTLNRLTKEQMQNLPKKGLEATPEEVKASRLTPDRIRGLRKKLGISMRELGVLTGSSVGAILSWEKGKFKPRGGEESRSCGPEEGEEARGEEAFSREGRI